MSQPEQSGNPTAPTRPAAGHPASGDDAPGEVFARVAHELKTPIAVSKGFAITMRDSLQGMDEATIRRCCEAIVRSLSSAERIVQSLEQTRSLESGDVQLDLNEQSVGDFVVETVRDLEPLVQPHRISTVIKSEGSAWFDRVKVRQVISNLLSNAAKFSPSDAPIVVEVAVGESSFEVCVTDRGRGIAAAKMSKLFKKYERLGSDQKGTGLGLYISRGLARAHGGDLTATSDGRSGCRFCLVMPLDPSLSPAAEATSGEEA